MHLHKRNILMNTEIGLIDNGISNQATGLRRKLLLKSLKDLIKSILKNTLLGQAKSTLMR